MCNACGFLCCASDEFEGCGCDCECIACQWNPCDCGVSNCEGECYTCEPCEVDES